MIAESLDKAVVKEVDPIDLIGSGIPNSYNTQYPIRDIKDLSELSDIFSHDIGIIFFLGDLKQLVSESNRLFYVPTENRNIEHSLLAVTLLDFTRKEQYGCCCSPGEAADICGGIDIPIVVNYKAYGPHKSFLQSFGRPLYIYCDRAYINAIEIIKNYTADTKRYSIISYDDHVGGLSLLIIELEKNVYFFLPMVSISEVNLLTDIEAGRLNLQRTLIIDDALLEQFDTIMNSIFYY